MPIHVLDENTINKIAAGEVVDRPSSIVKELVENAIDAGSTSITVEIKDGGITLIRVTDNGKGIPKDQLRLAFTPHATSKIEDASDLACITSLGFRGEALSSICAVSQVELITKIHDSLMATRYEIEGGKERSVEDVGAPDGSTFLIRNLFYNTPARRKFLKTAATEAGYISSLMEHMALSHPEIAFRFIQNNQPKLQTIGNGNLRDVIYAVYGKDITNNLIELHSECDGVRLEGYIGKPSISRGNRTFENYFINDRYIKNNIVAKAIEDAYDSFIMLHQYPFCVFNIRIDPSSVDVNVHPSKMEMRFSDNQAIYEIIKGEIRKALTCKELIPDVSFGEKAAAPEGSKPTPPGTGNKSVFQDARPIPVPQSERSAAISQDIRPASVPQDARPASVLREAYPESDSTKADEGNIPPTNIAKPVSTPPLYATKTVYEKPSLVRGPEPFETQRNIDYRKVIEEEANAIRNEQMTLFEKNDLLQADNEDHIRIIGQAFDTYWIIELENNIYIIDQHAAHEKVNFEHYMKAYRERRITTQQIVPPVILELTLQEAAKLEANLSYLEEMGYEIEDFGGNSYKVTGIPADFTQADPRELLTEIVDSLDEVGMKSTPDSIYYRIATISCKASIKGGNRISLAEASELIHELMSLDNPYNCPHGRPTLITMSKYELDKKFKRIV